MATTRQRKSTKLVHKSSSNTFLFSKPSTLLVISMACIFFVSLVLFLSLSPAAVKPRPVAPSISPAIRQACKVTRFPSQCETSLTQSNQVPPNPTLLQLIQSAIWVSSQNLHSAQSMVKSILDSSAGNANRTMSAKSYLETLRNSDYRTSRTTEDALPHGRIKDARIWMSTSLLYVEDQVANSVAENQEHSNQIK